MNSCLRDRGVGALDATVAADLAILAFTTAQARWADPTNSNDFTQLARQSLRELQDAAAGLD